MSNASYTRQHLLLLVRTRFVSIPSTKKKKKVGSERGASNLLFRPKESLPRSNLPSCDACSFDVLRGSFAERSAVDGGHDETNGFVSLLRARFEIKKRDARCFGYEIRSNPKMCSCSEHPIETQGTDRGVSLHPRADAPLPLGSDPGCDRLHGGASTGRGLVFVFFFVAFSDDLSHPYTRSISIGWVFFSMDRGGG